MPNETLVYIALIALIALAGGAIYLLTRLDILEDGMEYDDPRHSPTQRMRRNMLEK
jgi:hypothetical protein